MQLYRDKMERLKSCGVNVAKGIEALSAEGEEMLWENQDSREAVYGERLEGFLKSYDFMKLGQAVTRRQWSAAGMTARRLRLSSQALGLDCFDRWWAGLAQAISRKDMQGAKQLLSLITQKRVQLRNVLAENREP